MPRLVMLGHLSHSFEADLGNNGLSTALKKYALKMCRVLRIFVKISYLEILLSRILKYWTVDHTVCGNKTPCNLLTVASALKIDFSLKQCS